MKTNKSDFVGAVIAIGLLTIGTEGASAGPRVGGYFSGGNPGGLPYSPGAPLAHTPGNQAWETNNAWATYNTQARQSPGGHTSAGTPR
jgi:hypothetical protein